MPRSSSMSAGWDFVRAEDLARVRAMISLRLFVMKSCSTLTSSRWPVESASRSVRSELGADGHGVRDEGACNQPPCSRDLSVEMRPEEPRRSADLTLVSFECQDASYHPCGERHRYLARVLRDHHARAAVRVITGRVRRSDEVYRPGLGNDEANLSHLAARSRTATHPHHELQLMAWACSIQAR